LNKTDDAAKQRVSPIKLNSFLHSKYI